MDKLICPASSVLPRKSPFPMPRANCSPRQALAADPCFETYLESRGIREAPSPGTWLAASPRGARVQNRRTGRDRFLRASYTERGDCAPPAPIRAHAPRRRRSRALCHRTQAVRAAVREFRNRVVLAALHKSRARRPRVPAVRSAIGSAALHADRGEVIVKGPAWPWLSLLLIYFTWI